MPKVKCPRGLVLTRKNLKEHVDIRESGCWEWRYYKLKQGYGAWIRKNKLCLVTHAVIALFDRPLRHKECACHRCDNPACVRPDHLFIGTHQENMADCRRKGRCATGERSGMAKLTDAQVLALRTNKAEVMGMQGEVAKKLGVTRSLVNRIIHGYGWTHIQVPEPSAYRLAPA